MLVKPFFSPQLTRGTSTEDGQQIHAFTLSSMKDALIHVLYTSSLCLSLGTPFKHYSFCLSALFQTFAPSFAFQTEQGAISAVFQDCCLPTPLFKSSFKSYSLQQYSGSTPDSNAGNRGSIPHQECNYVMEEVGKQTVRDYHLFKQAYLISSSFSADMLTSKPFTIITI